MVRLVDDLLDVSRIMRGKIALARSRVPLALVVAAVARGRPPADRGPEPRADRLAAAGADLAGADPVRLAQVVTNLLNNAAKYTPRGGHIWLTVGRRPIRR